MPMTDVHCSGKMIAHVINNYRQHFSYSLAKNEKISDMIGEDALSIADIEGIYPHSRQYIIPQNQRHVQYHGLVLYNTERREDGAETEATNLSSALADMGCQVTKERWTHTNDLQNTIFQKLMEIKDNCSFVFACIMSHGRLGQLCGSQDSSVSINTIIRLFEQHLHPRTPLVSNYSITTLRKPA